MSEHREKFVKAAKDSLCLVDELCEASDVSRAFGSMCDAFVNLECECYQNTPKSHVYEGDHEACRAAIRKEVGI